MSKDVKDTEAQEELKDKVNAGDVKEEKETKEKHNGIKNHLEEAYFRDMSGCELAEIEQAAGEKCQPIGHIGYYYPAEVWISEYGKLYAKYEYQDEIECFPDVFALIERELRQCKFDSAAMKTVEALDGKL